MKSIDDIVLRDLAIGQRAVRGITLPVKNCYHFCSDGSKADVLFARDEDYILAMNRIALTILDYDILILAFCLMDNHFHFILYGEQDECVNFIREYTRCTGIALTKRSETRFKLDKSDVSYKVIDNDQYLKTAICYVLRNPTVGRLPFPAWFYPYSSCSLVFARSTSNNAWCRPSWLETSHHTKISDLSPHNFRSLGRTAGRFPSDWTVIEKMIFPGHYVATDLVEQIFITPRAYLYFISSCKDQALDEELGCFRSLTIPDKEMRENRDLLLQEIFAGLTLRQLNVTQRTRLAHLLKSRYGCPAKQIARLVGLSYPQLAKLL